MMPERAFGEKGTEISLGSDHESARAEAGGNGSVHVFPGDGWFETERAESRPSGRVITLAFLSEHVPFALIMDQLAGLLLAESGEAVVVVRFNVHGGAEATQPAVEAEQILNGEFHMPPWPKRTGGGFHVLTV